MLYTALSLLLWIFFLVVAQVNDFGVFSKEAAWVVGNVWLAAFCVLCSIRGKR